MADAASIEKALHDLGLRAIYGDKGDGKGADAANDVPSNLKLNTLLNEVLGELGTIRTDLAALAALVQTVEHPPASA